MASSSAECSLDKPPCSLVSGQDSTICDIVWVSLQERWSESVNFHFFLQAPQWPCPVRKWFRKDHCYWGRAKPGCRIVGSSTRWALTTEADFQDSLHWLLISTSSNWRHKGFLDGRRSGGGLEISWCIGQLSWALAFATSLSVAAYLRRAGGSMLARTGSHESGVGRRVPEMRRIVEFNCASTSLCGLNGTTLGHSTRLQRAWS